MTDLNTVILVGRLTKDLELKYTTNGMAVGTGSIAVNREAVRNSEKVKETSFFNFSMFGKIAESLKVYMTKGKQICLQGALKQRTWNDENGGKHSVVEIIVENVQLLGGGNSQNNQSQQYDNNYSYDNNTPSF